MATVMHHAGHLQQRRAASGERLDRRIEPQGILSVLSSTGLAFRRCELVRVNGDEIGVKFVEDKVPNKKKGRALAKSDS